MKVFMADRTSAANWVRVRLPASYRNYPPAVDPEEFDARPVLLTQPAEDSWTPLPLSELFLPADHQGTVTTAELDNAGHSPLEDPGLKQMEQAVAEFVDAAVISTEG